MIDEIDVCPVCRNTTSVADLVRVKSESKKPAGAGAGAGAAPTHKTSTKLDALLEEIVRMRDHSKGTKCIVFSQWTSMLDLIQTYGNFGTVFGPFCTCCLRFMPPPRALRDVLCAKCPCLLDADLVFAIRCCDQSTSSGR